MKPRNTIYIFLLAFFLIGCGAGGTETGTTNPENVDLSGVAEKIGAAASALVPQINESDTDSSIRALADGTSEEWDTYKDSWVVTDIFGDPDEEPQTVTKIRVLINQFSGTIQPIFEGDTDVSCTDGSALSEGDTIEIPFYGEIDNGSLTDRYFDCQQDGGEDAEMDNETIIYGVDSDNVVRVVRMATDESYENTDDVATRGTDTVMRQVVYATYVDPEEAEGEDDVVYLDIQYAQSTMYEGVDGEIGTDDDVVFRSRSRITGQVTFDADDQPTSGTGDFLVTKHDIAEYDITTKTIGRGSYGAGEYSLFKIDSDASSLEGLARTFCVQIPTEGDSEIPVYADPENCTDLETTYAWETDTFSFTLTPSIEEVFDNKSFFEGNDTDLIANDGSNFTMPTYE